MACTSNVVSNGQTPLALLYRTVATSERFELSSYLQPEPYEGGEIAKDQTGAEPVYTLCVVVISVMSRALRKSRPHRWRKDKVQFSLKLSVCSAASSKLSPPYNQELRSNVTGPRTREVCYTAKIAEAESVVELVGGGGRQSISLTFMELTSFMAHGPPQLRMCLVEGAQRRNEESTVNGSCQ